MLDEVLPVHLLDLALACSTDSFDIFNLFDLDIFHFETPLLTFQRITALRVWRVACLIGAWKN